MVRPLGGVLPVSNAAFTGCVEPFFLDSTNGTWGLQAWVQDSMQRERIQIGGHLRFRSWSTGDRPELLPATGLHQPDTLQSLGSFCIAQHVA